MKNKKRKYKVKNTDILQRKIKTMNYGKEYYEKLEDDINTK